MDRDRRNPNPLGCNKLRRSKTGNSRVTEFTIAQAVKIQRLETDPAAVRAKKAASQRAYYAKNPNEPWKRLIRGSTRNALLFPDKAHLAWVERVGVTPHAYRRYLEALWLDGMTWENRGPNGWHVDHIIALKEFNLQDPDQRKHAFHFKNTQPLWAEANRSKLGTREDFLPFAQDAPIMKAVMA